MVKVTFTLDDETLNKLRTMAARLKKPQSQVVREAVADYAPRADRLGEDERRRMLQAFDRFQAVAPKRSRKDVEKEIAGVRRARRAGGRRTRVE